MYNDASFLHVFGYVYGCILGLTGLSVCISCKPHVTELCFLNVIWWCQAFAGKFGQLTFSVLTENLACFPPILNFFLIHFCWLLFSVSSAIFFIIGLIICFKVKMPVFSVRVSAFPICFTKKDLTECWTGSYVVNNLLSRNLLAYDSQFKPPVLTNALTGGAPRRCSCSAELPVSLLFPTI